MIKAQCVGFLNTPSLWEGQLLGIQQFVFPELSMHAFHPNPIPQNIRLGHQVEHIFKQLLEHSEAYNVILNNLPIRLGGRTLGEIDFILRNNSSNRLIHVELTYKFYLIDPDVSEPSHRLIGPNRRDLFHNKVQKIKEVQFPLLHTPAGAKGLGDNNIDHLSLDHQCCFKAQLFEPFDRIAIAIEDLNPDCLAGYWLRFDDLAAPNFTNARFYMPTKSEWVIEPNDQVVWKSHAEILVNIESELLKENAPLIWKKCANAEFERFFVVWW